MIQFNLDSNRHDGVGANQGVMQRSNSHFDFRWWGGAFLSSSMSQTGGVGWVSAHGGIGGGFANVRVSRRSSQDGKIR
jgi:hypothetical protein